jgi:hypothetical protein
MKTRHDEIREAYEQFDSSHPKVWTLVCKYTFERINRGFKNYSINAILERVRWETDQADVDGRTSFKVNNNFHAFYARKFMTSFPHHEGFFRLREQISKTQPALGLPELTPEDFPETTV